MPTPALPLIDLPEVAQDTFAVAILADALNPGDGLQRKPGDVIGP